MPCEHCHKIEADKLPVALDDMCFDCIVGHVTVILKVMNKLGIRIGRFGAFRMPKGQQGRKHPRYNNF